MSLTREESIRQQQDALAQILRDPIEQIANDSIALWQQQQYLENILLVNFSRIPYCAGLYALNYEGQQITEYVTRNGIVDGTIGNDHSSKPYINKIVPAWGFLVSDIYYSQLQRRPSLTAVQVVRSHDKVHGYIGVDFDLRDLPFTSDWFQDSMTWTEFCTPPTSELESHATRTTSRMDINLDMLLDKLDELLTRRGIFQCHLHFASNQITLWSGIDPYQYRILDQADLAMRGALSGYASQDYPARAAIPRRQIRPILLKLRKLRFASKFIYLRHASINIINGMINLGFTCDSSQYLYYQQFIQKNIKAWLASIEASDNARPMIE